jgi:hypothetical protein
MLVLFSKGSHHKPKKNTEIPFSKRIQKEDIGIIFPTSPKYQGIPVFK